MWGLGCLLFFYQEKKRIKRKSGVRDAGQFGLVRDVYLICFLFLVFGLSSFLLLIEEKKQKKIKASAEAGEAVRVHEILCYVPGKLRRRPQPPFLDVRKESKENQGVRDAGQVSLVRDVYSICFLFFVFRLSSFLALMQEKNQKKIKASGTPANLA
ncbi:hypothetical protein N425_12390 [Tannerella sp. oral taxon BU063 isolate Cell 2]|uniref:Uncharacterized protein n=1 Tax=Tannerella sp. oral taxon BU063 isolate Cell 2 TaxID=1411148 RepID=W2C1B4_9BACT|nr:hypothetical protein N425_12390 [Tannerella sp. oral taxon BU063 isolate Cell 2]